MPPHAIYRRFKGFLFPFCRLREFISFKHREFISLNKGSLFPLGKISARRYTSWRHPSGAVATALPRPACSAPWALPLLPGLATSLGGAATFAKAGGAPGGAAVASWKRPGGAVGSTQPATPLGGVAGSAKAGITTTLCPSCHCHCGALLPQPTTPRGRCWLCQR